MAGVEVLLAVLRHNLLHFLHGLDMMRKGEELATLFSVIALAYFLFTYSLV